MKSFDQWFSEQGSASKESYKEEDEILGEPALGKVHFTEINKRASLLHVEVVRSAKGFLIPRYMEDDREIDSEEYFQKLQEELEKGYYAPKFS